MKAQQSYTKSFIGYTSQPLTILQRMCSSCQLTHVEPEFCSPANAEVLDDGTTEEMSEAKAIGLRFAIMAAVVLVATLSFQILGSVESIVGAECSMSSSMLLPAFFYLRYDANSAMQNLCFVTCLAPVLAQAE